MPLINITLRCIHSEQQWSTGTSHNPAYESVDTARTSLNTICPNARRRCQAPSMAILIRRELRRWTPVSLVSSYLAALRGSSSLNTCPSTSRLMLCKNIVRGMTCQTCQNPNQGSEARTNAVLNAARVRARKARKSAEWSAPRSVASCIQWACNSKHCYPHQLLQ